MPIDGSGLTIWDWSGRTCPRYARGTIGCARGQPTGSTSSPARSPDIAMNIYHVWCDLKPGVGNLTFSEKVSGYLGHLKEQGVIDGYRLTRRKLGLAPAGLGEFHLMIEVRGLAQLDAAFEQVAGRRETVESFHFGFNSLVTNATFALYRDFPDPVRHAGEEKF